ncbi:hypothetical protein [Streptomyces sp. SID3343]|uniref:hypothetical protein n=1 Tax=Streptomyces sp. SID3343 TaxID=2690260 RepID=UPI001F313FE0|nr:hypothetical protein [Streptomyces sp. SID3343]
MGGLGGIIPRTVPEAERPTLWGRIENEYQGPGGAGSMGRHAAHEFRAEPGRRMLYIEDHC